jgi:hypothetical protein
MANPTEGLQKVGSAKLQMYFFDIYYSELYSASGTYRQEQLPLALKIQYLRNIKAKDLIQRTKQEWSHLGYDESLISPWIQQLDAIWPDVADQDVLTIVVNDNGKSEFFFNQTSIGRIEDPKFGSSFLDIWLNQNGSYPKLRKKLIGG